MPGFNIEGAWSEGPPHQTELRRKHRWLFTVVGVPDPGKNRATLFLQKCTRPTVKYGEAIMHHDQEQAYFAGKTEWEPITLDFYDAEQDPDVSQWIWDWVCGGEQTSVADIAAVTVARPNQYKKQGKIEMRDGRGSATERWKLEGMWPQETNWGELDYSTSDIAMVTVKCRFDRAIRVV